MQNATAETGLCVVVAAPRILRPREDTTVPTPLPLLLPARPQYTRPDRVRAGSDQLNISFCSASICQPRSKRVVGERTSCTCVCVFVCMGMNQHPLCEFLSGESVLDARYPFFVGEASHFVQCSGRHTHKHTHTPTDAQQYWAHRERLGD